MSQSKKVKVRFNNGSVMDLRLDFISGWFGGGKFDITRTDEFFDKKLGSIESNDIVEELKNFFSNTNNGVRSVEQFWQKKGLGYFPRLF